MGDTEATPTLIIVLLLIVILLDWLGTISLFADTPVASGPSATTLAPSQVAQVFIVPTPAPGRESASSAPLSFTSGNFAHDDTSFHYEEDAPRWVHEQE